MSAQRLLYAACMVAALVTGIVLRRRSRLPARQRWGVAIGAIVGGALAAKLPFVLLGRDGFFSAEAWFGEGKTILAGLAGGYLGVELAKLLLGVRAKTGDGFAVPLAAAMAVGRWGCLFNG